MLATCTYQRYPSLKRLPIIVERRRLPLAALERLRSALTDPNSGLFIAPVDGEVADTLPNIPRAIVPDMPDPIISTTALHPGLPLVTRYRRLQADGIQTIWYAPHMLYDDETIWTESSH